MPRNASVVVIYILCLFCGKKNPNVEKLRSWAYTHRGLYGDGAPENSLEAFRLAKEAGYGVELDVHLLKDGNLAVFHDTLLSRMTGLDGRIVDLTTEDLQNCHLDGTGHTIPTFSQVLHLFDGKVPMIVELKEVGNCAALCEKACKMMEIGMLDHIIVSPGSYFSFADECTTKFNNKIDR